MARSIATISGTALMPGVSRNGRWYKAEAIAKAVPRAQARLAEGHTPMVMLVKHPDKGKVMNSGEVAASITGWSLGEDGSARFTAAIADTQAAHEVANLLDTSDGQPAHLEGVSIRGHWLGVVRKVKGPGGDPVETADDLELLGLDFTPDPGVTGARVDTFAWAGSDDQMETTERVPITESVQEALVTGFTEDATTTEARPEVPSDVREAVIAAIWPPGELHILEDGRCATCLDEARTPLSKRTTARGPGGPYADPGYLKDKKPRYQLDTKAHAKAAWAYISQKGNAGQYTSTQLSRIKGRIIKALRGFGVKVSTTEARGWMFDTEPAQVSEAVLEWMDPMTDAARSGSWSINASNGPVNINLSSYCMDPGDLDVILRAAADAACKALAALDPDMDGDVDVPGVGDGSDTDDDSRESAAADDDDPAHADEPEDATEAAEATDPASDPAAATQEGEPAVSGTSTTEAAGQAPAAAALDPKVISEAVSAALAADREARKAKKAKKAAQEAANANTGAGAVTETAAAEPAAATQTAEQRATRIKELVTAGIKEALADDTGTDPAVEESDGEMVARLIKEGIDEAKQALVAGGKVTPGRRGVTRNGGVQEHRATEGLNPDTGLPTSWGDKPLHEMDGETFDKLTGPAVVRHVLGDKADLLS